MIDDDKLLMLALSGYPFAAIAIAALWRALLSSQRREAHALKESIEYNKTSMSRMEEFTAMMSSIHGSQRALKEAVQVGFAHVSTLVTTQRR